MGKNDIEKIEQVILGIVQSNLAAKVVEVNTDKGDSLLTDIDSSKYFNDFYQAELTGSKFIFFGIEQPETQSVGRNSAETWTIFYKVFIEQENKLSTIRSAVLRYTRALKEIINENSDKIARVCSKGEISNLTPENVEDINNNNTPFKMGGIEFKVTLS